MNVNLLEKLLQAVKEGRVDVPSALDSLKRLPFEDLEFATLDTHRALRQGYPEVIFGQGKTAAQIKAIIKNMLSRGENVLATRIDPAKGKALLKAFPKGEYREVPATFFVKAHPVKKTGCGNILVISAGTSDVPVAEEAATTAEYMGNPVKRLYDVGVSGIHRLLHRKEELWDARVLIVVAGMEGALP
ncbi:MAG: 1-(5-phosphoribosyl)-5-amino-4-imidazole-carboxylate carboxylase, partial [Deltaproteobacteria bacterium]|nr:1-(5-phosphoribosyl)-5-amino-4-imidazole-carboxylate carboxylase [Deltaproteobacteria bacterium]